MADLQVWETEWTTLMFAAELDRDANKLTPGKAAIVLRKAHNSLYNIQSQFILDSG